LISPFSDHLLRRAWSLPAALSIPSRRPVTVLYHGVPSARSSTLSAAVFEQHIVFLKRHFEFASPDDVPVSSVGSRRRRVLLTFDDGFRNNAEVVAPLLRKYQVPAIFFVSSRHATPGKYLWFSHLTALERSFPGKSFSFQGQQYDMTAESRQDSIARLRKALLALTPHPARMYQALEEELPPVEEFVGVRERADLYAGMTAEQVGEMAADPLFSFGVHTADHPFLSRCEPAVARQQIQDNRRWLESATGRRCDVLAYPAGDYDTTVLRVCEGLGFTKGFAVAPRLGGSAQLELARVGIYAASTDILGFKVQWGHLLRSARIPVG
jgi:peptidoglycan/xylan/chitin deacetylase (PgdA/CDA1 family)